MKSRLFADKRPTGDQILIIAGIALLVVAGALFYEWKKSGNGLFAQPRSSEDQAE